MLNPMIMQDKVQHMTDNHFGDWNSSVIIDLDALNLSMGITAVGRQMLYVIIKFEYIATFHIHVATTYHCTTFKSSPMVSKRSTARTATNKLGMSATLRLTTMRCQFLRKIAPKKPSITYLQQWSVLTHPINDYFSNTYCPARVLAKTELCPAAKRPIAQKYFDDSPSVLTSTVAASYKPGNGVSAGMSG